MRLSCQQHTIVCASVAATLFAAVGALLHAESGPESAALTATAQLWDYKELCRFTDPPDLPGVWRQASGAFAISYRPDAQCQYLMQYQMKPLKLKHPPAVRISMRNDATDTLRVPIRSLTSVTVTGKDGNALPAVLWRTRIDRENPRSAGEEVRVFVTEVSYDGVFVMVPAKTTADFVFFFRAAGVGDIVHIGDFTSVKIE